jgi:Cu2+-containing amine oxidase
VWAKANRRIEQTDLAHLAGAIMWRCAEDWPVMPVVWHSFELRPLDSSTGIR